MAGIELDHVQLVAPRGCESEARRFFGGLLGLPEVEKPELLKAEGGVWFRVGTQQIHIGVEEPFAPARKAHPALVVSSERLDALAACLEEAGSPVNWADDIPGVRRFHTADPWGSRLELLSRV